MLARASFQNYKALKAVEVDLSPFTVIVGRNGSGKTSVLQGILDASRVAMRVADERIVTERIGRIFQFENDPSRLITRPAGGAMRIVLTDTDHDSLSLEATLLPADNGGGPRAQFAVAAPTANSERMLLPGPGTQQFVLDLARFLGSPTVRKFGSAVFLRLDARRMMLASVADSETPELERNGEGLASVLAYMAGAEPEMLEALRRDLTAVVPQVRRILTFPAKVITANRTDMGHRIELDMGEGRRVPADMLSEGTVLALGLLTALRHPSCPRLVLMDDIDSGLHSTAQSELVRCLRQIQKNHSDLQIVCTSHSADLLDQVALDEVRVMALDANGYARCRRLIDHPEAAQWRSMLRTGEFWASVGEDWVIEADGAR